MDNNNDLSINSLNKACSFISVFSKLNILCPEAYILSKLFAREDAEQITKLSDVYKGPYNKEVIRVLKEEHEALQSYFEMTNKKEIVSLIDGLNIFFPCGLPLENNFLENKADYGALYCEPINLFLYAAKLLYLKVARIVSILNDNRDFYKDGLLFNFTIRTEAFAKYYTDTEAMALEIKESLDLLKNIAGKREDMYGRLNMEEVEDIIENRKTDLIIEKNKLHNNIKYRAKILNQFDSLFEAMSFVFFDKVLQKDLETIVCARCRRVSIRKRARALKKDENTFCSDSCRNTYNAQKE